MNKLRRAPIKLASYYRELSAPVKMSFWFLITNFLQKGVGMLTTPIFTRVMLPVEYGRYSVYVSWENLAYAILTMNIASGFFVRALVVNEEDKDKLTSSLLGLTACFCTIGAVLYLPFQQQINRFTGLSSFLTFIIFLETFLVATGSFWSCKLRVDFKYQKIIALSFCSTLLSPILAVILVLKSPATLQTEARVLSTLICSTVFYIGIAISIFFKGRKFVCWKYWKQAVIFSLPLIPHYLSKIVLSQADRVMISGYCGMDEAGYYSVAHSLAFAVQIFNTAVASSLDPWLYKCIKANSIEKINAVATRILILMGVLNIMVISVAPELMRIMAPGSYFSAIWVIPPITAAVFFTFMYDLFASFQYYFSKTKWVMYASLVGAVMNIVLNMLFIPRFGFVAAGYTTLVCYILFAVAHYIFMCKVCDAEMGGCRPYNIKKLVLVGAGLLGCAAVMTSLYTHPIIRYAVLLCNAVVVICKRRTIIKLFKELCTK